MPIPNVDWNRPAGVPTNGAALWEDPTWRDLDAGTVLLLRSEVISVMEGNRPPESSGPGFGVAALAAGALGLGLAAAGAQRKKRR